MSATNIFDLSLDIKYIILDYLDNMSLAHLAQTCTYFGLLVRKVMSFRNGQVTIADHMMPKPPPFLNYRAGVSIGSTFYMPFINESPFCYCYDLDHHIWTTRKLNLIDMAHIQPQITCASVIGNKIYLVGGRLLNSYILSNAVIEIDTDNFNTRIIKDAEGSPPRPRHEHSVDAVADRFLVVFGGLCYNSVGENDVYVYDKFDNRWFVPPVTGHLPHLRFGHASAVIGTDLYIHGGAQLDNDSSYIVYDDLYKLDCKEWVWYKYEHPEVERYLRNQDVSQGGPSSHREHLISTNGDSPYDRFQSYMCNYGHKLIIFGGHSIREDEDDNEILCSYSLDELCVFNVKRNAWSLFHASVMRDGPLEEEDSKKTEESLTVSDMSIAPVMLDGYGIRIYIFAGHKAAEEPRSSDQLMETDNSSHSFDSNHHSDQHYTTLPSITEQIQSDGDDTYSSSQSYTAEPKTIEQTDGLRFEDNDNKPTNSDQGDLRTPNHNGISTHVEELFQSVDPDMINRRVENNSVGANEESEIIAHHNASHAHSSRKDSRRRPSISVIHRNHRSNEEDPYRSLPASSSSHSSLSSSNSPNPWKSNRQRKITPCSIVLELFE